MRLMTSGTLKAFIEKHPQAATALSNWRSIVNEARWTCPQDLLDAYRNGARILPENRAVFNICHNDFRLIVWIRWATEDYAGLVYIKFFGTHAEYDKIDALTVDKY